MSIRIPVRLLCAIAVSAIFVLPCPAQAQEGTAQTAGESPSGEVTMHIGRGALFISATGGDGMLTFQGQTHKFKLGGMGLGMFGFTKVEAAGEVYHLSNIDDFPGAYAQGGFDYAAGDGEGFLWLRNTKGVVLKLRTKTKGLALAVGGEGVVIQMGEIKK